MEWIFEKLGNQQKPSLAFIQLDWACLCFDNKRKYICKVRALPHISESSHALVSAAHNIQAITTSDFSATAVHKAPASPTLL